MNEIQLITIDLDGTLLDSGRNLPGENRKAMEQAVSSGKMIVIATGSPYELIPFELLEGIEIAYAITANGAAVYEWKSGKCLAEKCLDDFAVEQVLPWLLTKDIHLDLFIAGRGYCPTASVDIIERLRVPLSRKNYLKQRRIRVADPMSFISNYHLRVQKITMNFYPDENGVLTDREEVQAYLSGHPELNMTSGCYENLEITDRYADKGGALRELCRQIGVSLEHTMAIGDSLNDLSVMQAAGVCVAMGNAVKEIKATADFITLNNDACGVAAALGRFV